MKSKLDFTKDKLRVIVLELANLNGYEKPSTYLNELLNEIKQFNSFEFECDFFLNIHYLCKENSAKFWSEAHRKDISKWLRKSRIVTDVFSTTWDDRQPPQTKNETEQDQQKENPKFIEAPVIKLFCAIVHQCDLLQKEIEESPEKFIIRVINKYSINANPKRARQYFNAEIDITIKDQKKYLSEINKLILPSIEAAAKQQIETYLQSKNLYA